MIMLKIKFKSIVLNIFCFLIISSCLGQRLHNAKDNKVAIIEETKYIYWVTGYDFSSWKPNEIDFKVADDILIKAINLNQFYFLRGKNISEIKKYYRQYLCYVNERGEKIIYINSMCELFKDYDEDNMPVVFDWKTKMIDIADGGECYWNVKLNITTQEFFELKINNRS